MVSLWNSAQEYFLDICVCKERAPYLPFDRLIGLSVFGGSFVHVEDSDSDNIQEIISLGRNLVWNDSAVCGGRIGLKILVRE